MCYTMAYMRYTSACSKTWCNTTRLYSTRTACVRPCTLSIVRSHSPHHHARQTPLPSSPRTTDSTPLITTHEGLHSPHHHARWTPPPSSPCMLLAPVPPVFCPSRPSLSPDPLSPDRLPRPPARLPSYRPSRPPLSPAPLSPDQRLGYFRSVAYFHGTSAVVAVACGPGGDSCAATAVVLFTPAEREAALEHEQPQGLADAQTQGLGQEAWDGVGGWVGVGVCVGGGGHVG